MIHTPVNLRGYMLDYVNTNLEFLEQKIGEKIEVFTPHDKLYSSQCTEQWLGRAFENDVVPDLMLTHATEFASFSASQRESFLSSSACRYTQKNPLRKEFLPFTAHNCFFYPAFIVPLIMFYNPYKIKKSDLANSWTDLFNKKFKVLFPARDKPLSRVAGAYLNSLSSKDFQELQTRITYEGSPANVIRMVCEGDYDISINTLSFALMTKNQNIALNCPKEGFLILPQVFAWKKESSEKLDFIADLFMTEDFHRYLNDQEVWSCKDTLRMSGSELYGAILKNWKGWDVFLREVSDFDNYDCSPKEKKDV